MGQQIIQVDSFTDRPFAGNPAAVCLMSGPAEEGWMQAVAREMNLSNTAFFYPDGDRYQLRWFTPRAEVELCGHATLASAHVLWQDGHLALDEAARFITKSGELVARRDGDWIEMDFPATPVQEAAAPAELSSALDVVPKFVGKSKFDYLVEIDSEQTLRALKPDFGLLAQVPSRAVIVTAASADQKYDFVSRCFAPSVGVPEDPATGSTHCALGPYWSLRLGKQSMAACQASERGGVLRVTVDGERVRLGGQAVTVLRGELVSP
ncbi:MAG TPA: PhzF family phenazine biosynthesis protein [Acidobacteriota bacterium]|nr:PhzF family phenazine biosynthesis protein [Acidobacteriota bacterium]